MNISVIGSGGFGTTISILLSGKGYHVRLWANFPELAEKLSRERANPDFLPGHHIPENILITNEIGESLENADLVVIAIPSSYFRQVLKKFCPYISRFDKKLFLSLTKGIEEGTCKLPSEVFREEFGTDLSKNFYCLSGPNLALEIAGGVPTSAVIAGSCQEHLETLQSVISNDKFRIYTNNDQIGVQVGGAFKNVIAIAAGICDGLSFGLNTKSSLITRGLAEIIRLGVEMGALPHTFYGLSGMGDLVATSFSPLSRNRTFGERIGRGEKVEEIIGGTKMVIEGVTNAKSFYELSRKLDVEVPITEKVFEIIYKGSSPVQAVSELMTRKLKVEIY
ncbi:MAG: NAD(P)-dependent glycerol-3-phosphate dehydrogenase [Candidatus Wallbacteria bacterium]|nr:NAD(P)-dependent glycerol-3-phosphate dehydrogenase [Candidatus Wallbacteria bacterium]